MVALFWSKSMRSSNKLVLLDFYSHYLDMCVSSLIVVALDMVYYSFQTDGNCCMLKSLFVGYMHHTEELEEVTGKQRDI